MTKEMTEGGNGLTYAPLHLRHDVINRWLVSGIFTRTVRFEPMTMEGDVNDWLIKGFSIHENPCRKEFVEQRRSCQPEVPLHNLPVLGEKWTQWGKETPWEIYFPWGNSRVEESGFYYVPTHLLRYAYTTVSSPTAHRAGFHLKTCGGVILWVNGRQVCDFTPFTRNVEQTVEMEIELLEGDNTFFICHEDLAERDTLYHFTLEYAGSVPLEIRIPLTETESAGDVSDMEDAFNRAYFPKDNVTDDLIRLHFEAPFQQEIQFDVKHSSFFGGLHKLRRELEAGQQHLTLGHTSDYGVEYTYFEISTTIGKAVICKKFGVELYNSGFQPENGRAMSVKERKQAALACVASLGIPNIHTAIAKLKTGEAPEAPRDMILHGLAGIQERRDCADFYLISLFRFWRDYRNSGLFEEAFWTQIKDTILGFRYWIDEPGDDVMWFFSENHALLFHSCQLLAGQLFPDERFANSGEYGFQRKVKAEQQLLAWFDRFFSEGLAEWNSSAYIPIDFLGLIQLHDLAELPVLREQAKRAMDLLYRYMTAEAHDGYFTSTFGRSYEKELLGNHAAGTTSLIWVGYGTGNVNSTSFNVSVYLSDYTPPQELAEHTQLKPGEELEFRLDQGKDGYAKLTHYRTASFAMSSIADFRAGCRGYQEHVLHLAFSPEAQIWVNHPGEIYSHGSGRPSFWAGNGYLPKAGQYKGLGILLFDIQPGHDAEYTHAYFPAYAFSRTECRGPWFFAEREGAYAAVYAANGLEPTRTGTNRGRELVSKGLRNVWMIMAGDCGEYGSFEQFIESVRTMPCEVSTETLQVRLVSPQYGVIGYGWEAPFTVNGEDISAGDIGVTGRLIRNGKEATNQ